MKFLDSTDDASDEYEQCNGCDNSKENCNCEQIIQAFHRLNAQL